MPVVLTLLAAERGKGPFIEVEALVVLTGIYTAGGMVLDFTQLWSQTDPAGRTIGSDLMPLWADAVSMAEETGIPQRYKVNTYENPNDGTPPVPFTPVTMTIQVYSGITEQAPGALPNLALSDRIILKAVVPGQR